MAKVTFAQFERETAKKLEKVARTSALGAMKEVVEMSPVDKGRFRANWFPAVNGYSGETTEELDKTGAISIARAQGTVSSFSLGDFMSYVNNLPYAKRLEYGYSSQAPGGMTRLTAQRWQPIVDAAVAAIVK